MKKYYLSLIAVVTLIVAFTAFNNLKTVEQTYLPRVNSNASMSAAGAAEHYKMLRADLTTGEINYENFNKVKAAIKKLPNNSETRNEDYDWKSLGPDNIGGRTRAIYVDKNNTNEIWLGSVSGGLFKSTNGGGSFNRVLGYDNNSTVGSIAKAGNGNLYVGSGSSYEGTSGASYISGAVGHGLFRSTDNGETFTQLEGPGTTFGGGVWSVVDEIRADPFNENILWIANGEGLLKYDDSTQEYEVMLDTRIVDFDISATSNNGVNTLHFIAVGISKLFYSHDNGNNFTEADASYFHDEDGDPVGGRRVVAISPDDPNFMYITVTTGGSLFGIYASINGGVRFNRIVDGTSGIFIDGGVFGENTQGGYDNCLTVIPGSKGSIIQGGIATWGWDMNVDASTPNSIVGTTLFQRSLLDLEGGPPEFSIHSDVHHFHWDVNGILYIGHDGGVSRSFNSNSSANTYYDINLNYRSAQFYGIDYANSGAVAGGMQDNGTVAIIGEGNTQYQAFEIGGGDGFDVAFSKYDNTIFFGSQYNAIQLATFTDDGQGTGGDNVILSPGTGGDDNGAPFYTALAFFEKPDEWHTPANFEVPIFADVEIGGTINYTSDSYNYPLTAIASQAYQQGDTALLKDEFQSLFAYAYGSKVFLTRDAVNEKTDSVNSWASFSTNGAPICFKFSPQGNELYIGTTSGSVHRIGGLRTAFDADAMEDLGIDRIYASFNSAITDLALDPNDPDRLIISKGGYGSSSHVLMNTTASTSEHQSNDFVSIWSPPQGLNNMAVFTVVVDEDNPGTVLAGTDFGIFATTDWGATQWQECNTSDMYRVPIYQLLQQTGSFINNGVIYAGSFGGGIFSAGNFILGVDDLSDESVLNNDLFVYPNPVRDIAKIDLDLKKATNVIVNIYNITGVNVATFDQGTIREGKNTVELEVSNLATGSYFVNVLIEGEKAKSAKFIVTK